MIKKIKIFERVYILKIKLHTESKKIIK